jgi:tRNA A-37 threonylcarbamoyl transferase component Bud32
MSATVRRVLEDPDACLTDPRHHYKHYALATIARVPPVHGDQHGLVLRRLNYGRIRAALRDFFRRSRAQRAFQRSLQLEQAGVRTPRSIGFGEYRNFRWPRKAYVAMEEVPGAISLADLVIEHRRRLPRRVLNDVADLVAHLHNAGFCQRDLKVTNILLDDKLEPWLIDLDGVRYCGKISMARAAADLGVLARDFGTRPTWLLWFGGRFLRRYCQRRGLESEFRTLAGLILAEMRAGKLTDIQIYQRSPQPDALALAGKS